MRYIWGSKRQSIRHDQAIGYMIYMAISACYNPFRVHAAAWKLEGPSLIWVTTDISLQDQLAVPPCLRGQSIHFSEAFDVSHTIKQLTTLPCSGLQLGHYMNYMTETDVDYSSFTCCAFTWCLFGLFVCFFSFSQPPYTPWPGITDHPLHRHRRVVSHAGGP